MNPLSFGVCCWVSTYCPSETIRFTVNIVDCEAHLNFQEQRIQRPYCAPYCAHPMWSLVNAPVYTSEVTHNLWFVGVWHLPRSDNGSLWCFTGVASQMIDLTEVDRLRTVLGNKVRKNTFLKIHTKSQNLIHTKSHWYFCIILPLAFQILSNPPIFSIC